MARFPALDETTANAEPSIPKDLTGEQKPLNTSSTVLGHRFKFNSPRLKFSCNNVKFILGGKLDTIIKRAAAQREHARKINAKDFFVKDPNSKVFINEAPTRDTAHDFTSTILPQAPVTNNTEKPSQLD
ncbi:hypothetical protein SELMODRAFT_432118 [Selaginella moellendorffii]|uniref:Uncharacterized protein n=1 Tax=Selaginella moellendorffii TaxID=88036 RepID=D8TF15_SELML|nr:hypothetical protein SELMODRAFT_432118 [Selaginella moellendorffii]